MSELPFISVIVPVWNGEGHIASCLDALGKQSYPVDRFEVIVVDNGSTDDTLTIIARYSEVTQLIEPIASSYRARNLGLDHARGDYALFTDADCVADPDWIAAAVRAARANPGAGVLGGRIALFAVERASRACQAYEELFSFNQERSLAGGHCVTANWMSPLALLREMGGFDATLKSGGDVQMAERIGTAGNRLIYVPDMVVSHPIRGTYSEVRSKHLRTLGGRWSLRVGHRLRVLRALMGQTKGLLQRLTRTWWASDLALTKRAAITFLLARLYGEGLVEIARLALGGEPRRS